jgi:hypothetical protein
MADRLICQSQSYHSLDSNPYRLQISLNLNLNIIFLCLSWFAIRLRFLVFYQRNAQNPLTSSST